jgi:hypothetical protein
VDHRLAPWTLTWDEVDPSRHPFDLGSERAAVRGLARGLWGTGTGAAWADAVSAGLVERYGRWACGWRWARDEGDIGGGPVRSWCCPPHSVTTAGETARVAEALGDWRGWLEELAGLFDRYPLAGDRARAWERGSVRLVHHVVERTAAGDAWYTHCAQVLTWFLTRSGIGVDRAARLVDEAIGGRFDSWVGPADSVVDDVAGQLARAAATRVDDQARD